MWKQSNFNSGTGTMLQETFNWHAKEFGLDQAVWLAKYFGVGLNTVKTWASQYILNLPEVH
jgi:hypothetical protein